MTGTDLSGLFPCLLKNSQKTESARPQTAIPVAHRCTQINSGIVASTGFKRYKESISFGLNSCRDPSDVLYSE